MVLASEHAAIASRRSAGSIRDARGARGLFFCWRFRGAIGAVDVQHACSRAIYLPPIYYYDASYSVEGMKRLWIN